MKRAILGGTFDPIHRAHLVMAREAADRFGLDEVLFIPAANPPHKHTGTDYEHRYRMVELACAETGDPRFIPSRLEAGVAKSYSIHTIERVKAESKAEDDLYFVIGADAFAEVGSWYRWQDVVRNVTFIVVTRPGHEYIAPPNARVMRLDTIALPVSSSEIRAELRADIRPVDLPKSVLEYVQQQHLYQS